MLDFRDTFEAIFRTQAALAVCVVALLVLLAMMGILLELRIKRSRLPDGLAAGHGAGSPEVPRKYATDQVRARLDAGEGGRGVKQ